MTSAQRSVLLRSLLPRGERVLIGTVLLVQVVVASVVAFQSSFYADDFVFFRLARESDLSWDYARRSAFGHLIPVFQLTNKALASFSPVPYALAAVLMVAFHLACSVAMWRLLRHMVGPNLLAVLGTAMFGLSPIMVNGVLWWAASLCLLPSTAMNLATFATFIHWDRTRRPRTLALMGLSFLLAMASWEKSALTAAWIGVYSLIVVDHGLPVRERWRALQRRWPAWTVFAVLGGGYLAIYFSGSYLDESATAPGLSKMAGFLGLSAFDGLFPPLAGIRYPNVRLLGSEVLSFVIPAILCLGLIGVTAWRSARARAAWLFFLLVYVGNQAVLGRARLGFGDVHIGREYRYQIDNLYLFLVAAGVATAGAITEPASTRLRMPISPRVQRAGLASVATLVLACLPFSLKDVLHSSPGPTARSYFATFRTSYADLRGPDGPVALWDQDVPDWLVLPNMAPFNRQSNVLDLLFPRTRFGHGPDGHVVRHDGVVVEAEFEAVRTSSFLPDAYCARAGETVVVEQDFVRVPAGRRFVRVTFDGDVDSGTLEIQLRSGGDVVSFVEPGNTALEPGADEYIASARPTRSFDRVQLLFHPAVDACVESVEVGSARERT